MLEMSTLTGAILVALGMKTAGLFSNNDDLIKDLLEAGKETNEIMWHLPIFDEHRNYMKRDYCDLNNMSSRFFFFIEQFVD